MELKKAVAGYVLGDVIGEDLPAVALQALEDGYDSPSLCQLAGAQGHDTNLLRRLFLNALEELGLSIPSSTEAALELARGIVRDILDRRIKPYEGAKEIWSKIYTRFPELTQLTQFVGFASEYEDDERHRDRYEQMIVDECRIFFG